MSVLGNLKSERGHTAWDYADTIVTLLHGIKDILSQGEGSEPEHRRIPFSVTTDGSGNGISEIPIPRGERWILKGWAFASLTAATTLRIYAGGQDGSGLLLNFNGTTSGSNSGSFTTDEHISDSDNKIIIQLAGSDNNANVIGNLKVERFDKNSAHSRRNATG